MRLLHKHIYTNIDNFEVNLRDVLHRVGSEFLRKYSSLFIIYNAEKHSN